MLAAGRSVRLGHPKMFARVRGTSLLRSTVRLLVPLTRSKILVVVPPRAIRARAELAGYPVRFIENPERDEGLSTSVRRALHAARASAALLIVPVDLPRLSRGELTRMISRWRGNRRSVIARRLRERGGGIPVILPRRLFAKGVGISGDRGLKQLIDALPAAEIKLIDVPGGEADVDTREDLEGARRRTRR